MIAALHTSFEQPAFGVADGGRLVAWGCAPRWPADLTELVARVLGDVGLSADAGFDGVAAATGPGRFGAVRGGIAFAKGLALAREATLVGVPTAAAVAEAAGASDASIVLPAGRGRWYVTTPDPDGEIDLLDADELTVAVPGGCAGGGAAGGGPCCRIGRGWTAGPAGRRRGGAGGAGAYGGTKANGGLRAGDFGGAAGVCGARDSREAVGSWYAARLSGRDSSSWDTKGAHNGRPYTEAGRTGGVMVEEEFVVEPMRVEQLDQVRRIERACFPTPWPRNAYRREIEKNERAHYLVVRTTSESAQEPQRQFPLSIFPFGRSGPRDVVGYCGVWVMLDEAHITTIAVDPDYRRLGLGQLLIIQMARIALQARATRMTLEVRMSNEHAQALYRKYGFSDGGRAAAVLQRRLSRMR